MGITSTFNIYTAEFGSIGRNAKEGQGEFSIPVIWHKSFIILYPFTTTIMFNTMKMFFMECNGSNRP